MDTKYAGLDEFRERLQAEGWRIAPQYGDRFNECNWYAWSTDRDGITPDCACNDKPPSLVVYPHQIELGRMNHSSVEVEICGEGQDGTWFKLRAYAINFDEFFDRLPAIRRQLAAAWKAAAEG